MTAAFRSSDWAGRFENPSELVFEMDAGGI